MEPFVTLLSPVAAANCCRRSRLVVVAFGVASPNLLGVNIAQTTVSNTVQPQPPGLQRMVRSDGGLERGTYSPQSGNDSYRRSKCPDKHQYDDVRYDRSCPGNPRNRSSEQRNDHEYTDDQRLQGR